MINRKTGQIILEIPKSGSRSLVQAAIDGHGKKMFAAHGHHTYLELLHLMPTHSPKTGEVAQVVGVVREPEDRFLSQVNEYANIKQCGLDQAMTACITQSHIIFKPQWLFFEGTHDLDVQMFPLEDCHHAHELVAGKSIKIAYHRNSGGARRKFERRQVFDHPHAMTALNVFSPDYGLYALAKTRMQENV